MPKRHNTTTIYHTDVHNIIEEIVIVYKFYSLLENE